MALVLGFRPTVAAKPQGRHWIGSCARQVALQGNGVRLRLLDGAGGWPRRGGDSRQRFDQPPAAAGTDGQTCGTVTSSSSAQGPPCGGLGRRWWAVCPGGDRALGCCVRTDAPPGPGTLTPWAKAALRSAWLLPTKALTQGMPICHSVALDQPLHPWTSVSFAGKGGPVLLQEEQMGLRK